ncbi:hypothetical protein K469DRAFT_701476 [Zopfia rhizophila CBS 207.26]|uniref:Uncharacterized protein n=1 Tax=Zopfia rhizophila CBS 207.26 TaxID=1314779 RepID=A0A6A6D8I5_9PEZI|nr:hypothetical protein K469DRAFT_701476 [Zopfia rhizophila CBS 207.26]
MPPLHTFLNPANISAYAFSALCLLSTLPFIGIPFPRHTSAEYYAQKNIWLASLSPVPISPKTAGYLGAILRIGLGAGLAIGGTARMSALGVMGSVATVGTVLAWRDERPMGPQWGMLGATAMVWALNK